VADIYFVIFYVVECLLDQICNFFSVHYALKLVWRPGCRPAWEVTALYFQGKGEGRKAIEKDQGERERG